MPIRATDVLDLLANGLTTQQVLEELPDLRIEETFEVSARPIRDLGLLHASDASASRTESL